MKRNTVASKSSTILQSTQFNKKPLIKILPQEPTSGVLSGVLDKILILGSKGMLGGQFVKLFSSAAVGWDKEECDVLNAEDLKEKIGRLKPSVVINCVAFNDVDGAEGKPDLAFKLNTEAVGLLANICKNLDIPLIHFSTNYVFSGKKGSYGEADEPNPESIYGKTKHQGEIELINNTEKYYLIRTSVLFGLKGESQVSKKSFVELMLDLSQKNETVKAVDDEVNSLTYVVDLARGVEVLLREKKPFGIYHIINEGQASWYDFAKEIFEINKKQINLIPVPASEFSRKAKRPSKSVLVNSKLPPLRPWQEALNEFLILNS
jgi:dTDP-4-dehydrorhamnose reductase